MSGEGCAPPVDDVAGTRLVYAVDGLVLPLRSMARGRDVHAAVVYAVNTPLTIAAGRPTAGPFVVE